MLHNLTVHQFVSVCCFWRPLEGVSRDSGQKHSNKFWVESKHNQTVLSGSTKYFWRDNVDLLFLKSVIKSFSLFFCLWRLNRLFCKIKAGTVLLLLLWSESFFYSSLFMLWFSFFYNIFHNFLLLSSLKCIQFPEGLCPSPRQRTGVNVPPKWFSLIVLKRLLFWRYFAKIRTIKTVPGKKAVRLLRCFGLCPVVMSRCCTTSSRRSPHVTVPSPDPVEPSGCDSSQTRQEMHFHFLRNHKGYKKKTKRVLLLSIRNASISARREAAAGRPFYSLEDLFNLHP